MRTFIIIISSISLIYMGYRIYRILTLSDGLDQKIANGAIVLDVRTAEEYATGHIDGSVNISLGTIREKYRELDPDKTYITCCSHGLRSVKVVSLLQERGFKKVFNGGAWSDLEKMIKAQRAKE